MTAASYAIALGSNRATRYGTPRATLRAAMAMLEGVTAVSPIIDSAPLGPSVRRFANAAVLIESALSPPEMLDRLKAMERHFGRRRGQRWGTRPLDLDIILWSEGCWEGRGLVIPHPAFRERRFVLDPLNAIAPAWRDPITHRTIKQLANRRRHG
ncbi:2-amino-4-hydroxy-6-hydroxymethyldihydropteridine diphosphokinase [Stakelama sediminis]|uniref:2-amino-4-hydroxy-6-hydroxymethyldihydropteridine pyrophosphokinase n=1 Tax=Stakelama sediminis TaxID=463200 RepID=A0A840YX54_9SPHN|nr:2-amino-4-hydroxy-6-hydroxymethyldihydropteridine diphosphokinase [Stakelama sediminis]MBB5718129.1 2-amino-4-hydroxy-6-hydroxymethyldihydropteridine diphosphokinase [Stakelama sediminis]